MRAADGNGWAKDNILTVMNDAKLAAIDVRLVLGEHATDVPGSRVDLVTTRVAEYYKREKARKGVALLFLDVGTPKTLEPLEFLDGETIEDVTGGEALGVEDEIVSEEEAAARAATEAEDGDFNLYEDIKRQLIKKGVKSREIAFIHQAKGAERVALFEALQQGVVRVLIASTDKGATGMNIQDLLGMMVEVDGPRAMRPGDIQQRLGRPIRQGNAYRDWGGVEVIKMITKGTTDEWLYGLMGRKQDMIKAFMRGEADSFEEEDLIADDDPLALAKAEAWATNDHRRVTLITLAGSLPRLQAQATTVERMMAEAKVEAAQHQRNLPTVRATVDRLEAWIADHFKKLTADDFAITIGDQEFTSRAEANVALIAALKPIAEAAVKRDVYDTTPVEFQKVGEVRGLPILARPLVQRYRQTYEVELVLDADVTGEGEIAIGEPLSAGTKGTVLPTFGAGRNLVSSIQDRYNSLTLRLDEARRQITRIEEDIKRVEEVLANPSDVLRKLADARAKIAAIEAELLAESKIKDEEARRAHHENTLARAQGGGGGTALSAEGTFSETPITPGSVTVTTTTQINPVEFPELIHLAKLLGITPQVVKRFRGAGIKAQFDPNAGAGQGGIRLRANLFKRGQERQLAAALAHEIGHLADWLPDKTLTRGNLLGHLQTLTRFMLGEYTAADGTTVNNVELRAELMALSKAWRPWPADITDAHATYRKSAKELYADFVSALLNDPVMAEQLAPKFFDQFFKALEKKPAVKKALLEVWKIMSGTREELVARRAKVTRAMFKTGNLLAIELFAAKHKGVDWAELWRNAPTHAANVAWGTLRNFGEKHEPFLRRLAQDRANQRRARGESWYRRAVRTLGPREVTIAPDKDPFLALSERSYRLAGQVKAWQQEFVQPILDSLEAAGMDWEDFGEVLYLERILGDRVDIANPLTPAAAQEQLDAFNNTLSGEQQMVMRRQVDKFRAAVKRVAEAAHAAGLYTDETWETIRDNDTYATFHSLDHIKDPISSRIHKQIGSVGDFRNPGDSTVEKVVVTLRAIEHQRVKQLAFDYLHKFHATEIRNADVTGDRKQTPKEPPRTSEGKLQLVTYFEKGRLKGKYVDPYIAESLENDQSILTNHITIRLLALANNPFKAIVTTYNPAFQAYNLRRDWLRFRKAMPQTDKENQFFWERPFGITRRRALKRYLQARHFAVIRTYGLASPESTAIRKLWRTIRLKPASSPTVEETKIWHDLLEAERAGIIATSFSDHLEHGLEPEMILNILAKSGAHKVKPKDRSIPKRLLLGVRDFLRNTSDVIESLPKAAALYELKGAGEIKDIPADVRQFIRTQVGSPDFLAGGTLKPITNNVLVFSNAITQAWMADFETATNPTTRSGFLWKTVTMNVAPKALIAMALMAAAGAAMGDDDDDEDVKPWVKRLQQQLAQHPWLVAAGRIYRKVPSYDILNFIVIPIPPFIDSEGNAVVWRMPQDDTGRVLGGLAAQFFTGDRNFWQTMTGAMDYSQSQLPGLSPALTVPVDVGTYWAGHNVYNPFRRRWLFNDQEQSARAEGTSWEPLWRLTKYEAQQVGLGILWKFYMGDERPVQLTGAQALLDKPVISNLVGRFVKITKYGEVERNRAIGERIESRRDNRSLTEKKAVNEALRNYWDLPAGEQSVRTQENIGRDLAQSLYPNPTSRAEADANTKRITAMMKGTTKRGEADTLAGPVMAADSIESKAGIILNARRTFSTPEDFEAWLRNAEQQKIISANVVKEVRKQIANRRVRQAETVH